MWPEELWIMAVAIFFIAVMLRTVLFFRSRESSDTPKELTCDTPTI
jgi:hypothetical protein